MKVLFVGNLRHLGDSDVFSGAGTELRVLPLDGLDEGEVDQFMPDVIATPLFSDTFDCYDVGARLSAAEFTGQFVLVTGSLPHPESVLGEVARLFPTLDVELFQTG